MPGPEEILACYDREQRFEAEDPAMLREVSGPVIRLVSRHDKRSCVIHSRLTSENVESAIRDQIDYFNALGHSFEWKVFSHDTPTDLKERLMERGFELEETEAILALDLNELPEKLAQPVRCDVRRVTDAHGLCDVAAVRKAVWGEDTEGMGERLARELREQPERTRIYVAYVSGAPVCAGRLNLDPKSQFASLWGGSTIPGFRQRGLYTALVAVRAHEAKQRGARFLTVDARPMSRPILERIGFKLLTFANALNWRAK
jgi:hypothetical protein